MAPDATSPIAATPERFRSCVHALYLAPEPGAPAALPSELAPVRRCPVGAISALDCPELAGLACRCHEVRGADDAQIASRGDVAQLSLELAKDYLTAAYLRRLRPLRHEPAPVRGGEILAAEPVVADVAPPAPRRVAGAIPGVAVNLPPDHARGARALPRAARPGTRRP